MSIKDKAFKPDTRILPGLLFLDDTNHKVKIHFDARACIASTLVKENNSAFLVAYNDHGPPITTPNGKRGNTSTLGNLSIGLETKQTLQKHYPPPLLRPNPSPMRRRTLPTAPIPHLRSDNLLPPLRNRGPK
jgi:hypothetical protein